MVLLRANHCWDLSSACRSLHSQELWEDNELRKIRARKQSPQCLQGPQLQQLAKRNQQGWLEPLMFEEGKVAVLNIRGPYVLCRDRLSDSSLKQILPLYKVSSNPPHCPRPGADSSGVVHQQGLSGRHLPFSSHHKHSQLLSSVSQAHFMLGAAEAIRSSTTGNASQDHRW